MSKHGVSTTERALQIVRMEEQAQLGCTGAATNNVTKEGALK